MKILIIGNAGYIGPVVGRHLRAMCPVCQLIGLDAGYFAHCLTPPGEQPEAVFNQQIWGDVRCLDIGLLDAVDAIVYLAAISNDPMGKRFEKATNDINYMAGLEIAKQAKARGCRSFIFASSCSIYGFAESGLCSEESQLNPLTAYARSKVDMERGLKLLSDKSFLVTCLRFSTACGMSPRLRLDLVLNDFVASAIATGRIDILSDGTPWRPIIDVKDMARAIEWAISRDEGCGGAYLAVNVGSEDRNYQIKDLAYAVSGVLAGTVVSINEEAQPDKRSYKVDFSLFKRLAPSHQPGISLEQSVQEIVVGLKSLSFSDEHFRDSQLVRLKVLERYINEGRLTQDLRWV